MSASSRGMYWTGGRIASLSVRARVVSATTRPLKRTRTRLGLGAIVIGWSLRGCISCPPLELELQLGAPVLGPLEEELAERHRGALILEQHPDAVPGARRCPFEAAVDARVHGPLRRL